MIYYETIKKINTDLLRSYSYIVSSKARETRLLPVAAWQHFSHKTHAQLLSTDENTAYIDTTLPAIACAIDTRHKQPVHRDLNVKKNKVEVNSN